MAVLFKVLVGSRAHGLATPESDYDVRGVFMLPTEDFLGLKKPQEIMDRSENTHWEVGAFCRHALKCNPNIIEAMAAPAMETTPEGEELRSMLPLFLSRRAVAAAYKGFAASQKAQAYQGTLAERRMHKFASHYLRALYCGKHLLITGVPLVSVIGTEAEGPCRAAKEGTLPFERALEMGQELERQIDIASEVSRALRDEPDQEAINSWLISLRLNQLKVRK